MAVRFIFAPLPNLVLNWINLKIYDKSLYFEGKTWLIEFFAQPAEHHIHGRVGSFEWISNLVLLVLLKKVGISPASGPIVFANPFGCFTGRTKPILTRVGGRVSFYGNATKEKSTPTVQIGSGDIRHGELQWVSNPTPSAILSPINLVLHETDKNERHYWNFKNCW